MSKRQKVLLVRASYLETHLALNIVPPLGVLTLAAVLRKERPKSVEFRVVDTGLERFNAKATGEIVREYAPDVVGISALSVEAAYLHELAGICKSINPHIKVVIGGPHSTTFYDYALKDPNIDYAVIGEGEKTFLELLDAIRDGEKAPQIAGLAYKRDGEIKFGGYREFEQDLDSLPIPAWDLVDLNRYSRLITMNALMARKPYASLFTSRACPYKCIYCHSIFGKKFRAQSPERVLEEIQLLYRQYGARELHIYDDVFNFDRERVAAIMEGVKNRGIDVKFAFPNGIRSDILTRELIRLMAEAGVYSMTFAIETASPRIQKMIKKNLNLEKAEEAIRMAFEEKIIPCGFFMFGFPTETREEMEQTIKFAVRSKMLSAIFFTVVPFPRTELFELVRRHYPDFEMPYDFSPGMYYWSDEPYYTKVSGIDVKKVRFRALRSFYMDPWRIWNMMKRFPKNFDYPRIILLSLRYWTLGYGREAPKVKLNSAN